MATSDRNTTDKITGISGQIAPRTLEPREEIAKSRGAAFEGIDSTTFKVEGIDHVPAVNKTTCLQIVPISGEELNWLIENERAATGIYVVYNLDYAGLYTSPGTIDLTGYALVYFDGTNAMVIDLFDESVAMSPGGTHNG